ncbi:MAG: T9SS C-terminal target domain-containing protein [Calditrichaeota bacterium]|nr:MAG: T9SS C-terminal target domain-containing protein [Calditrichota bacterium]
MFKELKNNVKIVKKTIFIILNLVLISSVFANDDLQINQTDTLVVGDVGVISISSPSNNSGLVYTYGDTISLSCYIKSFSPNSESVNVLAEIKSDSSSVYLDNVFVGNFVPDTTMLIVFPIPWIPQNNCDNEVFEIEITITNTTSTDPNSSNNIISEFFTIYSFPQFTDILSTLGIGFQPSWDTQGACWGDINNDGWEDLYVVNSNANNQLYLNNGNGTFTSGTSEYGVGDNGNGWGAVFLDFDNDGWLDLYVLNAGTNTFYHNLSGTIAPTVQPKCVNIINNAGGTSGTSSSSRGISVNDFDNDGFVDFYIANEVADNYYYHNNGDSTFTELATSSGCQSNQFGHAVSTTDFNNDGFVDIYVGHDGGQGNILYQNNGNNTFSDVTNTWGVSIVGNTWDLDFFDYNNDANMDIFCASADFASGSYENILFENKQNYFDDVSFLTNVSNGFSQSWESATGDFDNDGWQDVWVVNIGSDMEFFYNKGASSSNVFKEVSQKINISSSDTSTKTVTWCDFDKDGDLDAFIGGLGKYFFYRNDNCSSNNYLQVRLEGSQSNKAATGTRLKLYTQNSVQIREIDGGSGRSQGSSVAHFGLRNETQIDSLVIEWHSGIHQVISGTNLTVNNEYQFNEESCNLNPILPSLIDFGDIPVGVIDTFTLVITVDSSLCDLFLYNISGEFPYTDLIKVDTTKLPIIISPNSQDSIDIYFENYFSGLMQTNLILNGNGYVGSIPLIANGVTDIPEKEILPQKFSLSQNHPNPFNPTTSINYELKSNEKGKLVIFNILGEEVKEFALTERKGTIVWDGTDNFGKSVSSGNYFYQLTTPNFSDTKKMTFLK